MNTTPLLLALLAVLCLAVSPAVALDIYGTFGLTTIAADDLDKVYESIEDWLGRNGLASDFSGPSNGIDLSAGVRQEFHPWMSFGVEFGMTFDNLTNNATNPTVDYINHADSRVAEFLGLLEFHPPGAPLLHFGGGAGYAIGSHEFSEELMIDLDNQPPDFYTSLLDANGSGPVYMLFIGVENPNPTGVILMARVGFRYRNLGEFTGEFYEDDAKVGEGTVYGPDGVPLEFDFSGVFAHIGIGYRFGVAEE